MEKAYVLYTGTCEYKRNGVITEEWYKKQPKPWGTSEPLTSTTYFDKWEALYDFKKESEKLGFCFGKWALHTLAVDYVTVEEWTVDENGCLCDFIDQIAEATATVIFEKGD